MLITIFHMRINWRASHGSENELAKAQAMLGGEQMTAPTSARSSMRATVGVGTFKVWRKIFDAGSHHALIPFLTLCFIMFLSTTTPAQPQTFTRDSLDYALDLPTPLWKAVSRVDVPEHFEFINGDDYSNGYLRLRKRLVGAGTVPEGIFREDEKWKLQRLAGYVACSNGTGNEFSGRLRGRVFAYEYVNKGVNMEGRIYYLKLDNRTFYALHFTVASEKLQALRDQMDSIARSFRLK